MNSLSIHQQDVSIAHSDDIHTGILVTGSLRIIILTGEITGRSAVSTTIVGIGSRTRTNVDDYVFTAIVHIATPVIAIINDSSGETWVTVVVRISRVIICPGFTDSLSTKHQISVYQRLLRHTVHGTSAS